MITVKDESSDAGLREPAHLERKEKAGMKVAPVAVIEVAGYDDKGNTLVTPIGGGVQIRPTEAVDPTNLLQDDGSKVKDARAGIDLNKLAPNQWWWD